MVAGAAGLLGLTLLSVATAVTAVGLMFLRPQLRLLLSAGSSSNRRYPKLLLYASNLIAENQNTQLSSVAVN